MTDNEPMSISLSPLQPAAPSVGDCVETRGGQGRPMRFADQSEGLPLLSVVHDTSYAAGGRRFSVDLWLMATPGTSAHSAQDDLDEVRSELRRLGYLNHGFERFLLQDALRPR